MTTWPSLDAIAAAVRSCRACDLHRTRTRAVPGEGPADARVMLVGEAPGYHEDRTGRPFVGAAGKTLDALLARAGLRREQVFITNIVKCRPPKNRDPRPAEIAACRPYLQAQITLLDPGLLILLGRFALGLFLPGARIGEWHGKPVRRGRRWLVPMYHPAAALYRPALKTVLEADFAAVAPLVAQVLGTPPATAAR